MNLIFASKEENDCRREKEFLALSYAERLEWFFTMLDEMEFVGKDKTHPNEAKGNFILKRADVNFKP